MKLCANRIKAILGIVVLMHLSIDVLAQCNQRIEVSKIVTDEQEGRIDFELKVEADQIYKGQVVKIEGIDQVVIKSFSGSGHASFAFKALAINEDSFYRVIIEYEGEERFLCKRRVKDILTDTK